MFKQERENPLDNDICVELMSILNTMKPGIDLNDYTLKNLPQKYRQIFSNLFKDTESYFLEVYSHMNKLTLINAANFNTLYAYSEMGLGHLRSIFINPEELITSSQMEYIKPLLNTTSFMLLQKINRDINLSRGDFITFLPLSKNNIHRLAVAIGNLSNSGLLTRETCYQSYHIIVAKVSNISEANADKKSRKKKENNLDNSHFYLRNSDRSLSFFIEHNPRKEYPNGAMGTVKKGYSADSEVSINVLYAVKIYIDSPSSQKAARKNARYHAMLGRDSWLYNRNNIFSTLYQWQEGRPLLEFTKDELAAIPFIDRLACLIDCLSQLEILHAGFRLHNDLTPRNFIINSQQDKMALIDFDGVTKCASSSDYHDESESMPMIIKRLFPEIFKNENHEEPQGHALGLLVSAMTTEEPRQRCTNKNSLNYCQKILQMFKLHQTVNDDLIDTIARETILQNKISFDDVLRGNTLLRTWPA